MRSNDKYTAMKTAGGKNYDDFVASLKSADAAGQAVDLADAVMSEISAQSSAGGSSLRMALYSGAVAAALTLLLALPSAVRGGTLPTEEAVPMASEESPWRREQGGAASAAWEGGEDGLSLTGEMHSFYHASLISAERRQALAEFVASVAERQ